GSGGRRTVTLPDGTDVLLNANSRMDVPADYNQGQRDILLKGDGFFEVAQDHQQPFRVMVNGIVTTALGTSFRIRAYPFEKNIKVMLLTGKVEVARQHNAGDPVPVYLIPGQEAILNKGEGAIQKGSFDISRMNNWKAGRLIFKDATLPEIGEELQNWYGVKVILTGNTSKKIHFNGEFDKDKDLQSVMKAIAFINGMKYDLEGEELTLTVE
ncbi:MAG TPA: FecR domain-containing protein, partial [Chitinophagaceae bacterium]